MKVYNSNILKKNQRLLKALLYAIPFSIILGLAYGIIYHYVNLPVAFSIVFIGMGYLIGRVIQEKGHGVKPIFSIVGAILAFVCFLIADMVSMFGLEIFMAPYFWGNAFTIWLNTFSNINGVLSLMFRLGGMYYAYMNARIV